MLMYSTHRVVRIIDGDTFDVEPEWVWNGIQGNRIRIANYDAPELFIRGMRGAAAAMRNVAAIRCKDQLRELIFLKEVMVVEGFKLHGNRLVCRVEINGRDLATLLMDNNK